MRLLLLSQISFLKMYCFSALVLSFREHGSPAEARLPGLRLIFPAHSPGSLSRRAQQRHVPGARGPGVGAQSPPLCTPVMPGPGGAVLLRELHSCGGVAEATGLRDFSTRNSGASGAPVQERGEAGSETPRLVNPGGCEEAVLVTARRAGEGMREDRTGAGAAAGGSPPLSADAGRRGRGARAAPGSWRSVAFPILKVSGSRRGGTSRPGTTSPGDP